jgi:hypothetical protein
MLNLSHYRECLSSEEAAFFGTLELDEAEPPISEGEAFNWINGRVFTAVWPDDEFPW